MATILKMMDLQMGSRKVGGTETTRPRIRGDEQVITREADGMMERIPRSPDHPFTLGTVEMFSTYLTWDPMEAGQVEQLTALIAI